MTVLLYVETPAAVVPITSLPPCARPKYDATRFLGYGASRSTGATAVCRGCDRVGVVLSDGRVRPVEGHGTVSPSALVGETVWLVTPGGIVPPEMMGAFCIPRGPWWVGEATIAAVLRPSIHSGWTFTARRPHFGVPGDPSWPCGRQPERDDYPDAIYMLRVEGLVERDETLLPCPGPTGDWDDLCRFCGKPNGDAHPGQAPIPGGAPGEMRRWA